MNLKRVNDRGCWKRLTMRLTTLLGVCFIACAVGCGGESAAVPTARVNEAVPQRGDKFWQKAFRELFVNARTASAYTLAVRKLTHGNTKDKVIALTFDDGPHPGKTEELLGLLKKENVKATFFLVGKMAAKDPHSVRLEALQGHEIANHTFSHPTLTRLSVEDVMTEYQACSDVIKSITGKEPRFCRPPGGDCDDAVVNAGARVGLITTMWTDDPGDFNRPDPEVLLDRTLKKATNGGIILLHDGIPQTMEILPTLITELKKQGFRFVTVSELLATLDKPPVETALRVAKIPSKRISR